MLKHFKRKVTNYYLFVYMISCQKSIKPFGLLKVKKKIQLNVLPVYDNRYIKTKRITYGDKIYTNFRGLNMPEDGVESVNTQMKDYLDDDIFESDKNQFLILINGSCRFCIMIKLI